MAEVSNIAIFWLAFAGLFGPVFTVALICSIIKAVRTRHEIKQRIKEREKERTFTVDESHDAEIITTPSVRKKPNFKLVEDEDRKKQFRTMSGHLVIPDRPNIRVNKTKKQTKDTNVSASSNNADDYDECNNATACHNGADSYSQHNGRDEKTTSFYKERHYDSNDAVIITDNNNSTFIKSNNSSSGLSDLEYHTNPKTTLADVTNVRDNDQRPLPPTSLGNELLMRNKNNGITYNSALHNTSLLDSPKEHDRMLVTSDESSAATSTTTTTKPSVSEDDGDTTNTWELLDQDNLSSSTTLNHIRRHSFNDSVSPLASGIVGATNTTTASSSTCLNDQNNCAFEMENISTATRSKSEDNLIDHNNKQDRDKDNSLLSPDGLLGNDNRGFAKSTETTAM